MPEQLGLRRLVETEVKSGREIGSARHQVANRIMEAMNKERKDRKPGTTLRAHEAFSIRELWDAFDGRDLSKPVGLSAYSEAAVVSSSFPVLTSNIFLNAAINAYELETGKIDAVVTVMPPSHNTEEIFPGAGALDRPKKIKQGEQYPEVQIEEKSSKSPEPEKEGQRAKATREAIWYDKTGFILRQLQAIGKSLRQSREERGWQVFTDHAGAQRFYPKTPSGYAQTGLYRGSASIDLGLWYKMNATQIVQPLNDWESIGLARANGYANRVDERGRRLATDDIKLIVVPTALHMKALEATGALQARRDLTQTTAPAGTSAAINVQVGPNPLNKFNGGIPDVLCAPYLDGFATDSTGTNIGNASNSLSWYAGDPKQSFFEHVVWDIEITPLPGDPTRDIVVEYLGSRKSDFVWQNDAKILRCLNVATA